MATRCNATRQVESHSDRKAVCRLRSVRNRIPRANVLRATPMRTRGCTYSPAIDWGAGFSAAVGRATQLSHPPCRQKRVAACCELGSPNSGSSLLHSWNRNAGSDRLSVSPEPSVDVFRASTPPRGDGMAILWLLILGFALFAAVQAVLSHREKSRLLPDDLPRSIAFALGAASSASTPGSRSRVLSSVGCAHSPSP